MSKSVIVGTDTVNAALITRSNANFTELYNMLTGVASPTLLTPTIASFVNAGHTHTSAAQGGSTLTGLTITGTTTIAVQAYQTTGGTLGSDWTEVVAPKWMKDPFGYIHLEGELLAGGSAAATCYTLPAGYCPATAQINPGGYAVSGAYYAIAIAANGVVTAWNTTAGSAVRFDGITFKAA